MRILSCAKCKRTESLQLSCSAQTVDTPTLTMSLQCIDLPTLTSPDFPPIANIHFRKQKVKQHLERIDPTKATGPDGIPGRVLRECSRELAGPVTQLFSLSFRRGVVPMLWKVASVVPVFKKPPKSNPCNYRPVSLLPILSKAMESVVNHQLVAYLERYHLLPDSQYGFRQGRGTADVLTDLQNEWTRPVASGGCVPIVALDSWGIRSGVPLWSNP